MEWDFIYIGSAPAEEDCVQVNMDNSCYPAQMKEECKRYIKALIRVYGEEPDGCILTIKWENHDFGSYCEVVCKYDTNSQEAVDYAFRVEEGLLTWNDVPEDHIKKKLLS